MTIATGKPKGKPRKLTDSQHKELSDRHRVWMQYSIAAAAHSPHKICQDLRISNRTFRAYLNRPLRRVS